MARHLYRFYLYIVLIALLIFIASSTRQLLQNILSYIWLSGPYDQPPTSAETIQSLLFAAVVWVVAGALAGLHYWLIRRDIRQDPTAGTSAIRSFFLNITEALCFVIAVPLLGFGVFDILSFNSSVDVSYALAMSLTALALGIGLEFERRRVAVGKGVALSFQSIHLYGVQIVLLITFVVSWFITVRPLISSLLFSRADLSNYNFFFVGMGVLWFAAWWIAYGLVLRKDDSRIMRLILYGLGLTYGVGTMISGIYFGADALLAFLFRQNLLNQDMSPADGVSYLALGLLIAGIYHLWLRMTSKQGMIELGTLHLTECAIVAGLSAASFWWSCLLLLYNLLQVWFPSGPAVDAPAWLSCGAFLIAGLGYVPFSLYLRHRYLVDPALASGPRRGLILALLGGGILSCAFGAALALYTWATNLFGSPVADWPQMLHGGMAILIIGAFLVGIYLRTAIGEHLFGTRRTTPVSDLPIAPAPVQYPAPEIPVATIEDILDDLLAGKVSREEAATRIRTVSHAEEEASALSHHGDKV